MGFQARAIAVLQAALGYPVRWIPGMPQQEEAPAELFTAPPGEWQSDLEDPDLQYADDERQRRIAGWQSLPGLGELAPLLACDPPLFTPLETLIRQLSTDDTFGPQVALLAARTNGSPTCFDAWLPTGRVKRSSPAICGRATRPSITGSSSILSPGLS